MPPHNMSLSSAADSVKNGNTKIVSVSKQSDSCFHAESEKSDNPETVTVSKESDYSSFASARNNI